MVYKSGPRSFRFIRFLRKDPYTFLRDKKPKAAMRKFVLCLTLLSIVGVSFAGVKGGKKEVTDMEDLAKRLGENLKKLDGQANGGNLELVHMHSATYQTVSGSNYEISAELKENGTPVDCTIVMWEKAASTGFKLDVECGPEKRTYAYESPNDSRRKRQLAGGFQPISQDELKKLDPDLKTIFGHMKNLYENFDVTFKHVVSGEYQSVAGSHAIVKIEAALKSDENAVKQCTVDYTTNLGHDLVNAELKCDHHSEPFLYPKA